MGYKILDQQGLNFLTFTIVDWVDLFTRLAYSEMVLESLRYCQEKKGLEVYAYVIMSNHVHLIISTENSAGLSSIVKDLKSYTARQFIEYMEDGRKQESRREWMLNRFSFAAKRNRRKSKYQTWKRDNHPIALFSPKVIRQKLDYIHYNPVVAKIVTEPWDYLFSSASNYHSGEGLLEVTILDGIWDDTGFVFTGM